MTTLKAEKRNPDMKAKKLRREGFTTGVLYGRGMKDSIPLQFSARDAMHLIKEHKEGSQVTLEIGSDKTSAIVKNLDFDPMKRQILALDFQALVAGEKISTSVPIKLLHEDAVQGIINLDLAEIQYKADPANLLESVVIDFAEISPDVKNIHVKDLKFDPTKKIELITPEDASVIHIGEHTQQAEEAPADADEATAE